MLHWLLSGAATVLAVTALIRTGQLSRRLGRVTQSYWELRYEHDKLRARLDKISPAESAPETRPLPPAGTTFVPLGVLTGKSRGE